MTRLSVIIPALNEEKYLPALLASLTRQTGGDCEVVVVDGSSTDRTVELARSYADQLSRLTVIVSEKAGISRQRNLGAKAASGDWLVFVDADAVLLPYFVERMVRFIEERNPALFTAWFRPDSESAGDAIMTLAINYYVESSFIFRRAIVPGPLTAVRRDMFESVGGYLEGLGFGEDYELTQKLVQRGVKPQILRETLSELSLRRVRKEGRLWFLWFYARASLRVLLTRKNLEEAPEYVIGGQYFNVDNPQ